MQKTDVTPKYFIKNQQLLSKFQCNICYEIALKPVRCQGPCLKIFCMKCVSDHRLSNIDKCPFKCRNGPFLVIKVEDFQIEFHCPYNSQLCDTPIRSLKKFNKHHLICQFMSAQESQRKKLQKQYKCRSGHSLEFWVGSYDEMCDCFCFECRESKLCRSRCRKCQQFFCVACRVPLCTKTICPIGHPYEFIRIGSVNYICDICGISTSVSNTGVYDDSLCNFGICEDCHLELPSQMNQAEPLKPVINKGDECQCGEKLAILKILDKKYCCQICKKTRECVKECFVCFEKYCMSCKDFSINTEGKCDFDHPFDKTTFATTAVQEEKKQCMKCESIFQQGDQYRQDKECQIKLCSKCYKSCLDLILSKQRPFEMKCINNHQLNYIVGDSDYFMDCILCKQEKIIKLFCSYCSKNPSPYCCECRPINLQTCYFKHPLKHVQCIQETECNFCMKLFKEFQSCKQCSLYVCNQCVYNSFHKDKEKICIEQNQQEKMVEEKMQQLNVQEKMINQKIEEQG